MNQNNTENLVLSKKTPGVMCGYKLAQKEGTFNKGQISYMKGQKNKVYQVDINDVKIQERFDCEIKAKHEVTNPRWNSESDFRLLMNGDRQFIFYADSKEASEKQYNILKDGHSVEQLREQKEEDNTLNLLQSQSSKKSEQSEPNNNCKVINYFYKLNFQVGPFQKCLKNTGDIDN